MLQPVPIYIPRPEGEEGDPTKATDDDRQAWLDQYGKRGMLYINTVVNLAGSHGFRFITGDGGFSSTIPPFIFLYRVTLTCRSLETHPDFFTDHPHLYQSITEQVWYYFDRRMGGHPNPIVTAYREAQAKKRETTKRKLDDTELVKAVERVIQAHKRQRLLEIQEAFPGLPHEMAMNIAMFLPARTVLTLLRELNKEGRRLVSEDRVIALLVQRDFSVTDANANVQETATRLMGKYNNKYISERFHEDNANRYFQWLLTSSLLRDTQGAILNIAWYRNMRGALSHDFAYLAEKSDTWSSMSILRFYYRTVGWTMALPYIEAREARSNCLIVGGSGLLIHSKFANEFGVHQLEMTPRNELEVKLLERIVILNEVLRILSNVPWDAVTSFFTYLLTTIDPTAELWCSLGPLTNELPNTVQIVVNKINTIGGHNVAHKIPANCVATGLRFGARLRYDYNYFFPHIQQSTIYEQLVLGSTQTFGAAFLGMWRDVLSKHVLGMGSEGYEDFDSDDEVDDDDNDVLYVPT